jgi:hypothetical protein
VTGVPDPVFVFVPALMSRETHLSAAAVNEASESRVPLLISTAPAAFLPIPVVCCAWGGLIH